MKSLLFISFLLISGATMAQEKYTPLVLKKGQVISVVSKTSGDAEMGMGISIKNEMTVHNEIAVTNESATEYSVSNTVNKLKGSIEAMGNVKEFDSENPKDSAGVAEFGETIGKPSFAKIQKKSAALTFEKGPEREANENETSQAMMKAFGNDGAEAIIEWAFMLLPANKKAGDTWIEKDSSEGKKSVTTYTIDKIENNIATISYVANIAGNNTIEEQGNQMNIAVNTKTTGEIVTDTQTGIVRSRTADSEVGGTIDIMGQSMPITGKNKMVTTFTAK